MASAGNDGYTVAIKPSARKELEALSDALIARLMSKMEALADDPRPPGCKKLQGFKDLWRVRVGEYRVVYVLDDKRATATVTRIAHRREVYE